MSKKLFLLGILKMYNPSLLSTEFRKFSVNSIVEFLKEKKILLCPHLPKNCWDNSMKSRFIESLLLRFPIHNLYFACTKEGKWVIADGRKRIATLKEFMLEDALSLCDLEYFPDLNNHTFSKLPRKFQRHIENIEINIILIESGTPRDIVCNLFKRINFCLTEEEINYILNQNQ